MHRFFIPRPYAENMMIDGIDARHIYTVLKMKPGEKVQIVSDDGVTALAEITGTAPGQTLVKCLEVIAESHEPAVKITLAQGLVKGEKMDFIIQKAVELGAYEIIPVEMKRCVVRLDGKKAEKKTARWQQIAESAAKQSKRMLVPRVHPVLSYKEALAYAGQLDVLLIPYELAGGMDETKKIIGNIKGGQSLGIFIGPEGGFEEEEVKMAVEKGASPITLGKRILRTETAGMAILSVLMFQLERGE